MLLLLDLKEQRRRERKHRVGYSLRRKLIFVYGVPDAIERTPLDEEERVLLQQTREMVMKCLEKRPKRPRTNVPTPPENASQSQNTVESDAPMPRNEPCNVFTDPDTIDMETLISRRCHWDRFLVSAPNVPGASSIPPVNALLMLRTL